MRARGVFSRMTFALGLWLAVQVAPPVAAVSLATITVPPDTSDVDAAVERGRKALRADDYVGAGKAFEEALKKPGFSRLSSTDQFRTVLLAAEAAQGREDYLAAHEFMSVATGYPDAGSEHWVTRVRIATWIDAWGDAGGAITKVAQEWPAALADIGTETIQWTATQMYRDKKLASDRMAMLNALFAARFQLDWHLEPTGLWRELVLEALDRNDMARAREVLARIGDPGSLMRMRIDRRFDELVRAAPKSFDVAAAAAAQAKQLRREVDANPRMLGAAVQYMYALFVTGAYQDALVVADRLMEKHARAPRDKPAFDDLADSINWLYDQKARALRGLGRWDEALAMQEEARRQQENSNDKVSQAINLGFWYVQFDRAEDALEAIDGVDWARSLSPYGRMQLQHVRFRAYLQLGKRAEAEKVFAYLREHKLDSPDTWQDAMLEWGDTDGAAAHFISRLRDPEQRTEALYAAQDFRPIPRLPDEAQRIALWKAMVNRPDVAAAIDEVGRREQQPIYDF